MGVVPDVLSSPVVFFLRISSGFPQVFSSIVQFAPKTYG